MILEGIALDKKKNILWDLVHKDLRVHWLPVSQASPQAHQLGIERTPTTN